MAKRCQNCGLVNPTSATRCDCGWSFTDGVLIPGMALDPPREVTPRESARQVAWWIVIASLVMIGVGLLLLAASHDRFVQQVGGGLGVVGVVGTGIARMLRTVGR